MPPKERADSAINCYCIRYHVDSVTSSDELAEALASKSRRWYFARHQTARPHYHWYLESDIKEQALRSLISRFRKSAKDTRFYSVSLIKTDVIRYGSYVMLKPEVTMVRMAGLTEDELLAMLAEAKKAQFAEAIKEEKKSKSVIALLQEYCEYCPQLTFDENFKTFYDFLVDNGLYNMYTEIKMVQLFGMWKAKGDRKGDKQEYGKIRQMYCNKVRNYFMS